MSEQVNPTAGAKLSPDGAPVSSETGAALAVGIPARYEQLLTKLALADRELEASDSTVRSASLEEASGIVFDLLYALDFRRGGEMVPRLAALYGYIGNELLSVGLSGDRQQLAQLRDMIATLRQRWYDNEAAA